MYLKGIRFSVFVLALLLIPVGMAFSEEYPKRPVTYIIPFSPGGQSDLEARRQQPILEKMWGKKVIIQYKPGGGGALAWSFLKRQKKDGSLICGVNLPHIILQPLARENAGFSVTDLKIAALFQETPIGLAVHKDSPFQSLEQFIAVLKDKPKSLTIAGSGSWSGHHITHLLFQEKTKTEAVYIPFKGAAPSVAAFLGKHTNAIWANSNDLLQHKDKIRILAMATAMPYETFVNIPTFKGHGYDVVFSIYRGIAVPAGTDDGIVKKLESAFLDIAKDPRVQKQMKAEGFIPAVMGIKESEAYVTSLQPVLQEIVVRLK